MFIMVTGLLLVKPAGHSQHERLPWHICSLFLWLFKLCYLVEPSVVHAPKSDAGHGDVSSPKLIPPLESQQGFYLKELTSGDGAEWVEPLPSIHKSLGRSRHSRDPAWRYTPVTSALGKRRPENQKFKVIPGYIASSEVSPGSKTNQF